MIEVKSLADIPTILELLEEQAQGMTHPYASEELVMWLPVNKRFFNAFVTSQGHLCHILVVKASYLVEDENGDIFETYQYETDEETATHDAFQDIIDDAADVIDNEFEPATYTVKIKFEVETAKSLRRKIIRRR